MDLILAGVCLVVIVWLYFYNNPLKHGRWFMIRRFINWFPLGMNCAFLYMGHYNLVVSKVALGSLMSKMDFGIISDKLFQSRRGPPAFLLCSIVLVMAVWMAGFPTSSARVVGWCAVSIVMAATRKYIDQVELKGKPELIVWEELF